jgi:hypothetical protein
MSTVDPSRFPLILGVAGHRDPLDPAALERQLEVLFREVDALAPNTPITLLSPLAEGCDQVFAEVGLHVLSGRSAGVELVAVLPFAIDDYRCDFRGSPAARARFESLLARASSVVELPPRREADLASVEVEGGLLRRVGTLPDVDGSSVRAIHYDRLGRFMAVHAHAMVAIWNGRNPPMVDGKRTLVGGTASIAAYCRDGGATGREGGIPLREEIPAILDNPRIPLFLVHARRRKDLAAGTEAEDLGPLLGTRFGLGPRASLQARAEAGAAFRGCEVGVPQAADLPRELDPGEAWSEFMEAVGQLEQLNSFPPYLVERGGHLPESPGHRGLRHVRALLRAIVWVPLSVARCVVSRLGGVMGKEGSIADYVKDTQSVLFERQGGADFGPVGGVVSSRNDPALRRSLDMFRRADAVAMFDLCSYVIASNTAILALGLALASFQAFSSWSSWWLALLYLVFLGLWGSSKRALKRRERQRAMARGLAEFLRVQVAWRLAGLGDLVSDSLGPRRAHLLGVMRYMLESVTLCCVVVPPRSGPTASSIEQALQFWVRDQIGYCNGNSVKRKHRKAARRELRKSVLRWLVPLLACVALLLSVSRSWPAMVGLPDDSSIISDGSISLVNLLMGLSLVMMLVTDLRGSIGLDREDSESIAIARPLYEAADRQIVEAINAGDLELARRVIVDLGRAVLDEQVEWYLRHRDGAQVEIVG